MTIYKDGKSKILTEDCKYQYIVFSFLTYVIMCIYIYIYIYVCMYIGKIFFELMVIAFKEKLDLQLPLIFYNNITRVFETAFISEQIVKNKFAALSEISDKVITKFNVFSYRTQQLKLKTIWKISKPYRVTLKIKARELCLKGHSFYHRIQR